MDWKLGDPSTFLGHLQLSQDPRVIRTRANQWRLHYTMFNQSHHHCRQSPLTQYFLTQNTRMCNLDNQFQSYRIIYTSFNRAGDVLRTIILKALPPRYIRPPSRTTPPSSPSRLLLRRSTSIHKWTRHLHTIYHPGPPRSGLSSRADMSDSSV